MDYSKYDSNSTENFLVACDAFLEGKVSFAQLLGRATDHSYLIETGIVISHATVEEWIESFGFYLFDEIDCTQGEASEWLDARVEQNPEFSWDLDALIFLNGNWRASHQWDADSIHEDEMEARWWIEDLDESHPDWTKFRSVEQYIRRESLKGVEE